MQLQKRAISIGNQIANTMSYSNVVMRFQTVLLGCIFFSAAMLSAQQSTSASSAGVQQEQSTVQPAQPDASATPTPAAVDASQAIQSPASTPTPTISPQAASDDGTKPVRSSRILGIIPNYRTIEESSSERVPLTPKQKFKTAFDDSFDFSAFLVAGFFSGVSMAQAQYKEFGVGAQGYGKYYGTAFADQAIGNFFTEAILPSALHQDPQYYTKGKGGFWKRTGYALEREVVTFDDKGHNQFNTSEIVGNAIAAGLSNAYYPEEERSASNTMQKWGQQIATDAVFNVMKEFWPDVRKKMFGK